jgi:nitrite transporter NirC
MGLSFGIALTLVVFAGSELFTGNNMFMVAGVLEKKVTVADLVRVWGWSWFGNLIGSMGLAALVVGSGVMMSKAEFVIKIAQAKMQAPLAELFLRGILCNWLVCLALWCSNRTKSDTAKCILIFWCLFAFIACGFEHSVANMTLLPMALFLPHSEAVNWLGFGKNLLAVTAGNIIGGGFFVSALYWIASRPARFSKLL